MCLATPAEVIEVGPEDALVDMDGVRLRVSTALVEAVSPGDIVLVHVGFALSKIDPGAAERTLERLIGEARA